METKPYGLKKPQSGDKGQAVFDALEFDIDHLDAHTHNGVDSAKINTSSLTKITTPILAAGWTDENEGVYSQLVAITGGMQFDTTTISFRDTDTGAGTYLHYVKVTDTSFRVYCNDPSKNITIVYV